MNSKFTWPLFARVKNRRQRFYSISRDIVDLSMAGQPFSIFFIFPIKYLTFLGSHQPNTTGVVLNQPLCPRISAAGISSNNLSDIVFPWNYVYLPTPSFRGHH